MGQIVRFACLVGLRPSEVIESVRLLLNEQPAADGDGNLVNNVVKKYYNPQRQALEHFRFPEIFIRQTKKAYISFISPELLSSSFSIQSLDSVPSWNDIRLACWNRGIKMQMHLARKVFASWLYQCGISETVINLLQGRVPRSILVQHYLVPKPGFKAEVLAALEKLAESLDS
jgi:intergrase/recombinase